MHNSSLPYIPDDIWFQIFDFATSVRPNISHFSYLDGRSVPDLLRTPERLQTHPVLDSYPEHFSKSSFSQTQPGQPTNSQAVYRAGLLDTLPTKRAIVQVCKRWNALGLPVLYREIVVGGRLGSGAGRRATLERGMQKLKLVRERSRPSVPKAIWDWEGVQYLEETICGENSLKFAPLIRALHVRIPPGPVRMPAEEQTTVASSLARLMSTVTRSGRLDTLVLYRERSERDGANEEAMESILEGLAEVCRNGGARSLRVLDTFLAFGIAEISPRCAAALNDAILHAPNLRRLEYDTHWHESDKLVLDAGTLESVSLLLRGGTERQHVELALDEGKRNTLCAMTIGLYGDTVLSNSSLSDTLKLPLSTYNKSLADHPSLKLLTLRFHSPFVPVADVADALHTLDSSPWCARLETFVLRVCVLNRIYAGVANEDAMRHPDTHRFAPLASPLIRRVRTFAVCCDEGGYIDLRVQVGLMLKALLRCLEEYRKECRSSGMPEDSNLCTVRVMNDFEGKDNEQATNVWKAIHVGLGVGISEHGLEWIDGVVKRFKLLGIRLENYKGIVLGSPALSLPSSDY